MWQRFVILLTHALGANAVRDVERFSIARVEPSTDVNMSTAPSQLCTPEKFDAFDRFCVSVIAPLALPPLQLEIAMKVEFHRDKHNCFAFKVAAIGGLRILKASVSLTIQYEFKAVLDPERGTMCSPERPTPKLILSYMTSRVLQWAKGQRDNNLLGAGAEVMSLYKQRKNAWKRDGTESPSGDLAEHLRRSLLYIHERTARFYRNVHSLRSARCSSVTCVIDSVLMSFKFAHTWKGGPKESETCLTLVANKAETHKYLWCYFTTLYTFTAESYRSLVDNYCEGGRDAVVDIWDKMTDDSLGIVVELKPELCPEAAEQDDCLVTLPRHFVMLFPCYTWTVVKTMVFANQANDALRDVLAQTKKEFSSSTVLRRHSDVHILPMADHIAAAVEEKYDQNQQVADYIRKKKNGRHLLSWERYILYYAIFFQSLVEPTGSDGKSYAPMVDCGIRCSKYHTEQNLYISVGVSGGNSDFCSAPKQDFRLTAKINLDGRAASESCISGIVQVTLSKSTTDKFDLYFKPKYCYGKGLPGGKLDLPFTITHRTLGCIPNFVATFFGAPEKYVCMDPEYQAMTRITQAMQAVMRMFKHDYRPTEGRKRRFIGRFKRVVRLLMSLVQLAIAEAGQVLVQQRIQKSAMTTLLSGLAEHVSPVSASCAKVVSQTINIARFAKLSATGELLPKEVEVTAKTQVGLESGVDVTVGGVKVKAYSEFMAPFATPRVAAPPRVPQLTRMGAQQQLAVATAMLNETAYEETLEEEDAEEEKTPYEETLDGTPHET